MSRPAQVRRDDAPVLRLHVGSQETPMSKPFLLNGKSMKIVGPTTDAGPPGAIFIVDGESNGGKYYFVLASPASA